MNPEKIESNLKKFKKIDIKYRAGKNGEEGRWSVSAKAKLGADTMEMSIDGNNLLGCLAAITETANDMFEAVKA